MKRKTAFTTDQNEFDQLILKIQAVEELQKQEETKKLSALFRGNWVIVPINQFPIAMFVSC